ncbi:MAG: DUF4338 domain-containing protein [Deltaproteobacteria bacterium]|nr:DUF4338 domain-containing protein [Deltaproteobacteria bacterium]MBW2334649.1 DUF4338 domain-containing protein [Deltaproteobacteria bacterium]
MFQNESSSIIQCGRKISDQEIDQIRETVGLFPGLSQTELAETLCEHLGWFTASGSYKREACLKLLNKLEVRGVVQLPEKRGHTGPNRPAIRLTARTVPCRAINGRLKDIGPISLEAATGREAIGLCNEYLFRYHYLGYKTPFGCYFHYFIESVRGILGCILFSGAAKSLGMRDRWIGWTDEQRLLNLGWVINNNRFLIFPWVKLKNLCSHVLGQVAIRIKDDWNDRWGYSPVLMETFVDPRYFEGSSYKASGWEYLGMTTGEGLARKGRSYKTTPKKIFVKPLVKNFRVLLCSDGLVGRREI